MAREDYINHPDSERNGLISLVMGILAMICLPLIGGILAIYFGNRSAPDNTMADVGRILGIVSLALLVLSIFVILILFTSIFGYTILSAG